VLTAIHHHTINDMFCKFYISATINKFVINQGQQFTKFEFSMCDIDCCKVEDEKKRSSEALPTISASVELKTITADQLKSLMEVSDIDQLEAYVRLCYCHHNQLIINN